MPIRKATTAGSRAFICLYSESGGGKTLSALLVARGMVGPTGKIVLIETENRRGEIYADDPRLAPGYDTLPLGEPFSPMAYEAAIQEAEEYGADAIVIDSGSHEWEGPGGVLDMAASISEERAKRFNKAWNGETQFGDWKVPKTAHKKMLQRIMRSSAHVIVCLRAQYKSRQIDKKDFARFNIESRKNSEIIRDDFQSPIQDANFIFETTVHLYFSNRNPGVPIVTKCPDMLLDAFPKDRQITTATGAKIAAFYESGSPTNKATAELIKAARQAAAKGKAPYEAFWGTLDPAQRRELVTLGEHDANKARISEPAEEPRGRLQDPPAEPTDDGDDDPYSQAPGPGYEDENNAPGPGGNYVEPRFGGDDNDF